MADIGKLIDESMHLERRIRKTKQKLAEDEARLAIVSKELQQENDNSAARAELRREGMEAAGHRIATQPKYGPPRLPLSKP